MLKYHIGVVNANVNYANTEAIIEYIPSLTSPEELKAALQSAGYDLMIDESDDAREDLDSLQQKKYENLKKKTIWAIVLAVPLMLIGMVFMDIPYANYIMWALSTPIVFVFGKQFFVGAWRDRKSTRLNSSHVAIS